MIHIDDANFVETINQHDLILVDFWAEWCGPCKRMLPILEEIDLEENIVVSKLNVDENPIKSAEYSIISIPTMVLFKSGIPVHTITGAKPKHALLKELSEWI
jgi:thioredoxin 1